MNIDVFVSYHMKSSEFIVRDIVGKLEASGLRCWYADRDTKDDYADSIVQALDSCSVFVLVLNKPASESSHVLNEINAIHERLASGEAVHIIPFHIADDRKELSRGARYYLGRINWIEAVEPPMYQRVQELVRYINDIMGRTNSVSVIVNNAPKTYRLVSRVPQARNVFHGREELLARIGQCFDSGKNMVFLEGIGGIGKSELAKQYALRNRDRYHTVLFTTYTSTLEKLFCDKSAIVIEGLEQAENESDADFFRRKLDIFRSVADKGVLLIVDNFDTNDDPRLKELLQGDYHVILTTRNAHQGYTTVKVEAMRDSAVLMRIFEENYGASVEEWELPYLQEIFALVDYHTYAIELIAKQMDASFLTAAEMLESLKRGGMMGSISETVSGRDEYNTAFGHICSLFNTGNLNAEERRILSCLSLCGTAGVLGSRFREWAQLDSFEVVNGLVRKSWIRKEAGRRFSLHPLVREVVQAILEPTARSCFSFLDQVGRFCYLAWFRPYTENVEVAGAVLSILNTLKPEPEMWNQFSCFSGFLWQVGIFEESIAHSHAIMDAVLAHYGEASMVSGFVAKHLAGCYFNSRHLEASIPWYRKGLEYMLSSGEPESEDLAMSYEKVARCWTWEYEQDLERAEEYFLKALEIRQRCLENVKNGGRVSMLQLDYSFYGAPDADHLPLIYDRIAETHMELGRLYQAAGDYEKALVYSNRYGEMQETHNLASISSRAYALYDQGVSLYHLGVNARQRGDAAAAMEYWTDAEQRLRRALEINMKMRGGLAIDTLDNQEYLADTLAAMGRYSAASNEYMAVLGMAEALLGSDHPRPALIREKMNFETLR